VLEIVSIIRLWEYI